MQAAEVGDCVGYCIVGLRHCGCRRDGHIPRQVFVYLWRMGICPNKCLVHSFYRIGGRRRFDLARISLLTLIGAWIWTLFAKPEPEAAEEQPVPETPEVKEEAPAVEEKAPAAELPERVIINEARLRTIFNSDYMTGWSDEPGKMYVDKVVEDLQFVRDNYKRGAKDKVHFADKHIIEIADILHKNRYFRKVTNSFTEWCCTMFDCLSIDLPERDNIKKPQEYSGLVKKRFYFLH